MFYGQRTPSTFVISTHTNDETTTSAAHHFIISFEYLSTQVTVQSTIHFSVFACIESKFSRTSKLRDQQSRWPTPYAQRLLTRMRQWIQSIRYGLRTSSLNSFSKPRKKRNLASWAKNGRRCHSADNMKITFKTATLDNLDITVHTFHLFE